MSAVGIFVISILISVVISAVFHFLAHQSYRNSAIAGIIVFSLTALGAYMVFKTSESSSLSNSVKNGLAHDGRPIVSNGPEWPPDNKMPPNASHLRETETHGWLLPAHDPTRPNGCDRIPFPDNGVLLVVGDSGAISTQQGKTPAVQIGDCQLLRMQHGPKGLLVDADVFSQSGILIARIQNNEFHLVAGQYSYSERPDRHTLAVYDQQGRELLWVRYLNPKVVKIRGVFSCPNYSPSVIFDDEGIHFLGDQGNSIISNNCAVDAIGAAEYRF